MRSVSAGVQLFQQAFRSRCQWPIHPTAAGALMPAAAKRLCHRSDVDRSLAAEADAKAPVRLLPEKQCHLDASDGQRIIDQSFTILFTSVAALHGGAIHMHPHQAALALQRAESGAQ